MMQNVLWSCTSVCLSVCLSVRGHMPTLLHGPRCNLGSGIGCPLVVHYWADLQLVHGLRCYGNITRTLVKCKREMLASAVWSLCAWLFKWPSFPKLIQIELVTKNKLLRIIVVDFSWQDAFSVS